MGSESTFLLISSPRGETPSGPSSDSFGLRSLKREKLVLKRLGLKKLAFALDKCLLI